MKAVPVLAKILGIAFFCLFFVPKTQADELNLAIEKARALKLSNHITWQRLLHFEKNLFLPGSSSRADDQSFFFAKDGGENAASELEATLRALYLPVSNNDSHAGCKFIARKTWLGKQLNLKALPKLKCSEFDKWYEQLNPAGLTLIFPAAYLNNPASMFGHTLLRIDQVGQTEKNNSLSYAVSYAATTTDRQGFVYAFKGIFGGYLGHFSVSPYYKMIKKYSRLENRDIWEYELNFSESELKFMLQHLWELSERGFDYYFFDENCSYLLLHLLEVAKPNLELTNKFNSWVIPSDTVKEIFESSELVKNAVYRPAKGSILKYRQGLLNSLELEYVKEIAQGRAEPTAIAALDEPSKKKILELAFDYFEYLRIKNAWDSDEIRTRGREILLARSELSAGSEFAKLPVPDIRPDQGHTSGRFSLGPGLEDGKWFYEIGVRPAYHDLFDPPGGFVEGAEIRVFDLKLRHTEESEFTLRSFTPLAIRSVSPAGALLSPLSWNLEVNFTKRSQGDGQKFFLSELLGGVGLGANPAEGFLAYSFFQLATGIAKEYKHESASGIGVVLGSVYNPSNKLGLMFEADIYRYLLGDQYTRFKLGPGFRWSISPSFNVKLQGSRNRVFDNYFWAGGLSVETYF